MSKIMRVCTPSSNWRIPQSKKLLLMSAAVATFLTIRHISLAQPKSQSPPPSRLQAETWHASAGGGVAAVKTYSQAYVDYLQAISFATEGSEPEALHLLADSMRLQPANNPASAIAYELLVGRRAYTPIKLLGHTEPINRVLYSRDGTKIATVSADRTARLWNPRTGSLLTPPLTHEEAVISAAFNFDGSILATGTKEGQVTLWNTATGTAIRPSVLVNSDILCVAFSPDGKFFAAGTEDGRLLMWSVSSGDPVSVFPHYHESVTEIDFNSKSTNLVAATGDDMADLLDIGGRRIARLKHENTVSAALFNPDSSVVLTASRDGLAALWNADTGAPLGITLKHNSAVLAATFSNDGSRIATGSFDHTARVWDTKTGRPITAALQHPAIVTEVALSADNRFIATASVDQTVRIWDATTGDLVHLPIRSKDGFPYVAFSPDSSSIAVAAGLVVILLDTPPRIPAPAWILTLTEFDASLFNKYDFRPFDRAPVRNLQHELEASKENDPWTRLGRWYFAPSAIRSVTPQSSLSLETYVSSLIKREDRPSLEYARSLSQGHPQWMEKITPLLAKTCTSGNKKSNPP